MTLSQSVPSINQAAAPAAEAPRAEGAGLGILAELPSIASQSHEFGAELGGSAALAAEKRLIRYALQSAARQLLPRERVSSCLRKPIPAAATVDVWYSAEHSTAHYGGLQVCASVWVCPVCSAKITERRRIEMGGAVKFWLNEAGGFLLLVTYTLRHNAGDNLAQLLAAISKAFDGVHAGRRWQEIAEKYRIWGKIRALEVTHGDHGWHPHFHVLYFIGSGSMPNVDLFETEIKERWMKLLQKQGRDATWASGVDIQAANDAIAEYVAKYGQEPNWKIEHEMTKSPAKIGRKNGKTAFQILKDYSDGKEGSDRLFLEYAVNFKGKSQLHWSKGLRSLLHLEQEKSEEEVAQAMEAEAILLAQLRRDQWRVILGNDARAELLNIASTGDIEGFWNFVNMMGA